MGETTATANDAVEFLVGVLGNVLLFHVFQRVALPEWYKSDVSDSDYGPGRREAINIMLAEAERRGWPDGWWEGGWSDEEIAGWGRIGQGNAGGE